MEQGNRFQNPCPNCGKQDQIESLQVRYLEFLDKQSKNKISISFFGINLDIGLGSFNPYERYIEKQQSLFMSYVDAASAFLLFLPGLLMALFPIVYIIIGIIVHLVVSNSKPINLYFIWCIPVGIILMALGLKIGKQSKTKIEGYWKAFRDMAEVPVCRCGKVLTDLPDSLG